MFCLFWFERGGGRQCAAGSRSACRQPLPQARRAEAPPPHTQSSGEERWLGPGPPAHRGGAQRVSSRAGRHATTGQRNSPRRPSRKSTAASCPSCRPLPRRSWVLRCAAVPRTRRQRRPRGPPPRARAWQTAAAVLPPAAPARPGRCCPRPRGRPRAGCCWAWACRRRRGRRAGRPQGTRRRRAGPGAGAGGGPPRRRAGRRTVLRAGPGTAAWLPATLFLGADTCWTQLALAGMGLQDAAAAVLQQAGGGGNSSGG